MHSTKINSFIYIALVGFLNLLINVSPSLAASVLAAWKINTEGVLQLRTTPGAKLEAFFQTGSGQIGDRIWIDFPGELSKPRKLEGNGPIKQIRLGKPRKGTTRLVVEFNSSNAINSSRLKLIGVSPTRWELPFVGLKELDIEAIGEGNVYRSSQFSFKTLSQASLVNDLNISNLPDVKKGIYKIILDPGHGGSDSGAVGLNGLKETDVVLDISKQIANYLRAKGVQVELTRYRDIDLELQDRVSFANKSKATAFVSIHANATRDYRRDISGVETYFYTGRMGRDLASRIQKELILVSGGSPDRGVRQSRFFVIRRTNMPAALVEVGFVTGRLDSRRLSKQSQRKRIAFAISSGILKYIRANY